MGLNWEAMEFETAQCENEISITFPVCGLNDTATGHL